jgi:hypothetical protein
MIHSSRPTRQFSCRELKMPHLRKYHANCQELFDRTDDAEDTSGCYGAAAAEVAWWTWCKAAWCSIGAGIFKVHSHHGYIGVRDMQGSLWQALARHHLDTLVGPLPCRMGCCMSRLLPTLEVTATVVMSAEHDSRGWTVRRHRRLTQAPSRERLETRKHSRDLIVYCTISISAASEGISEHRCKTQQQPL